MKKFDKIIIIPFILLGGIAFLIGCSSASQFSYKEFENNIITASQWGGTPAVDSPTKKHTISHITLHHQGETYPEDRDPVKYLQALQSWSRAEKKWIDIPYHYIIDLKGKIYEGRDIIYAGDTNTEYNPAGHALIEVVGNFEEVEPNQHQLQAVINTMTWLAKKYNVPVDSIRAHKDYSAITDCPGKNLYRYIENGYFIEKVRSNLNK